MTLLTRSFMLAAMDAPREAGTTTSYEILVSGELGDTLADDLGARLCESGDGRTRIIVDVIDQSHLHGVLERLRDLNVGIERVNPA